MSIKVLLHTPYIHVNNTTCTLMYLEFNHSNLDNQ